MKKIFFVLILLVSPFLVAVPVNAAPELPCWLSGLNDGFGDETGICEIPAILSDPNVSDKVKDQFVCDTMHEYIPSYVCPQYLYDANGMLVRDANGNVIIVTVTHLPKTGFSAFLLLIAAYITSFGIACVALSVAKRGDYHGTHPSP